MCVCEHMRDGKRGRFGTPALGTSLSLLHIDSERIYSSVVTTKEMALIFINPGSSAAIYLEVGLSDATPVLR